MRAGMALETTGIDAAGRRRLLELTRRTVNGLPAERRPHAGALVEAFGIPERRLAAAIGRGPGA